MDGAVLSDEVLAKIEARAAAATPGEWRSVHRHGCMTPDHDEAAGLGLEVEGPEEAWGRGQFHRAADAAFIAHSRQDIPALLAEVRRLRSEVERLTEKRERRVAPKFRYLLEPVARAILAEKDLADCKTEVERLRARAQAADGLAEALRSVEHYLYGREAHSSSTIQERLVTEAVAVTRAALAAYEALGEG